MKPNELTIKQAREKLDSGELTAVDLAKACLARIKEVQPKLNALITVCEKEALAEAELADERLRKGERTALLGIPYIAKDNILIKNIKTTAGSKILENYIAPYDATAVKRLKNNGAVLLAKANLDQFGHGGSNENTVFGPAKNPWDTERVAGGSSGGSAIAVSTDMCLFALGTDTGGSIRCPACFCGVNGLKTSYGRNSRFGFTSMTSSTDTIGPMAKTAEDCAFVLQVMAGEDKNDLTSFPGEVPDYNEKINKDLTGLKIGLPKEYFGEISGKGIDDEVREAVMRAVEEFKSLGAEVKEISLPHTKYNVPIYYILMPSEDSSNMARLDGIRYGFSDESAKDLKESYMKNRGQGFTPETKRRIIIGTYALSAGYFDAYYLRAQKVRTKVKEEMDKAFEEVDVMITPTQPGVAFRLGQECEDLVKIYFEDICVAGPSLAGLPAMSIPCGFSENLPIGMQIIGGRFREDKILQVAHNYQKTTNWHKEKPVI